MFSWKSSGQGKGFTLIELMISLGIAAGISLGLYYVLAIPGKNFRQTTASFEGDEIRKNIISWLQNDLAWKNTVADLENTTFDCLRKREDCRGVSGPFRIRNEKDVVFYDPLAPMNGYTEKGVPCSTFGKDGGDSRCPLRVDLSWTALCPAGSAPCYHPQVRVLGTSRYRPTPGQKKEELVFRTENYGVIDFVRPSAVKGVGSGTPNRLAKWKSPVTLEDSVATELGGRLGVGVESPAVGLEVAGSLAVGDYAGTETAPPQSLILSGRMGIGTDAPVASLDVEGGLRVANDPSIPCDSDLFGAVRWTGTEFQGCFAVSGGTWCSLAKGCAP